jgi:enoyl-[acyl-carrier protein] reductase II
VIGSAYMEAEDLRREIRLVKELTDKPFGVDIIFAEIKSDDPTATGYTTQVEEHLAVTFEEGAHVLVSGLGNPGRVVPQAHDLGMKVMSLVGTARQARAVEASGVDVVIASGHDGGGHVGRVGTMALVPRVVDAVDIPVLAAGGLADGRGLVASLALGAKGVWMGTRFIATQEARGHINYKQKIVDTDEDGTIVTRAHSGKANRMIRNQFTDSWVGRESEIKPYPLQLNEIGEPGSIRGRIEGDVDTGVLAAGQGCGLIDDIPPAGDVVRAVMAEARAVLEG